MIAMWMLYAVVLAALVGAAGACADALLRMSRRASRLVWAGALGVSLLAPFALALRAASTPAPAAPAATGGNADGALEALLAQARVRTDVVAPTLDSHAVDRALLAAWLVASGLAVGWLVQSRRRLRHALRAWAPASVDGETVLVAPNAGPAALAAAGGRIVLPTWALEMDEDRRALMLAHERAHLAARDPQLLTTAIGAIALMPWNPALWWQYRRLRVAVEIDCDRRVLRRHPDVASYGALLLDVARRGATHRHHLAAAFSAPTPATSLERRIRTMTSRRPRHIVVRALAVGALGTGLTIAACEAPHPTGLRPTSQVPLTQIRTTSPEQKAAGVDLALLKQTIAEQLPAVARGTGTAQMVYVVEDASGRIVKAAAGPSPTPRTAAGPEGANVHGRIALDGVLGSVDANSIATVDVFKLGAGKVAPDSTNVVWIRLKAPGDVTSARTESRVRAKTADGGASTAIRMRTAEPAREPSATSTSAATPQPAGTAEAWRSRGPAPALYVIDGRELTPDSARAEMGRLPRDTIATVNVLKGERAIVEYGERARDGVIVVTTKGRKTTQY